MLLAQLWKVAFHVQYKRLCLHHLEIQTHSWVLRD